MDNKPKGYFANVLAIDVETTGLAYGSKNGDPSYDRANDKTYQIVSIGLIVANADTLDVVEELYLEIKWDGTSEWNDAAERVHGLSKQHLETHGVTSEEAVLAIGNLILKYWGPDTPICLLGHNVATFDLFFLKRLMSSHGIDLRFGNRHVDTNSIGFATMQSYTSDEMFEYFGFIRDPNNHNALDDARFALASTKLVRDLWTSCVIPVIEG